MGLMDLFKSRPKSDGKKYKCPNCKNDVSLDMERCPSCGVRIKSMFRRKCPQCQEINELDLKKCKKCGYDFEPESSGAKKSYYVCPICRYKMEGFYTRCPACNTRFM